MDVLKSTLVFLMCLICVYGQTIKAIIEQRQELVVLKNYMKQLSFLNELGKSGKRYTFFAPHNGAFDKIPNTIRNKYGPGRNLGVLPREELNNIMKYHAVFNIEGIVYRLADLGDKVFKTDADDAAPLFFKKLMEEQYVNGARIVEADIQASNGVVHIIDHFLYEPAERHNALTYVQIHAQGTDQALSTRIFNNLLLSYRENIVPTIQEGFHALEILNLKPRVTFFVPNDYTMANIDLNVIKQNFVLLQQVVEAHIIPDDAYHEELLELLVDQDLPALSGHVTPKRFGKDLFVSNFCESGMIRKSNITVENGVVYIIDGVMGHVYYDLIDKMDEIVDLSSFATKAKSSAPVLDQLTFKQIGTQLPEDQMLTVFAPTNDAMRGHDSELLFDGAHLEKALRLHIIQGMLEVSDIRNSTIRRTLQDGYNAKFIRIEQDDDIEIWVEVNYVRGRIISGDICTPNGMLHKVDHIIGTPTETVYDYVSNTRDLSDLFRSVSDTGVVQVLQDTQRRMTMFVPTNTAFEVMREGDLGRRLLQQRYWPNLRNVLNRHVIEKEVIISELNTGKHVFTTKFGDTVTLEKTSTNVTINYGIFTITVLPYDMRMKNGMVHHVNRVFYDEGNPNAGEWSSAASVNSCSVLLLLICALCHLWSRTL